jgi:hypothetical protein
MPLDWPVDPSRHPGAGIATVTRTGTASTVWHRTGRVITGLPDEGRTEVIMGSERMPGERPPSGGRVRGCVPADGPGVLVALIS